MEIFNQSPETLVAVGFVALILLPTAVMSAFLAEKGKRLNGLFRGLILLFAWCGPSYAWMAAVAMPENLKSLQSLYPMGQLMWTLAGLGIAVGSSELAQWLLNKFKLLPTKGG